MLGSSGTEYLLFVGSEPEAGGDGAAISSRYHRLRGFVPLPPKNPDWGPPPGTVRWRIPTDQGRCVRLVLDLAHRRKQSVRLVDVNSPGTDPGLIALWKAGEGILPTLLSPDGRRLAGMSSFVPALVDGLFRGRTPPP